MLDKKWFMDKYKEAVKEVFPRLQNEIYKDQEIYGISFEILNLAQECYQEEDCYGTAIYLNTEEMYQENLEDEEVDDDEEEGAEWYYRFCVMEWDVLEGDTALFKEVQEYLQANCIKLGNEEDEELEEKAEQEKAKIKMWQAEALGELRKEGFWKEQGNQDIYVIPFAEEGCDEEEHIMLFEKMDLGSHGSEYVDHIEDFL